MMTPEIMPADFITKPHFKALHTHFSYVAQEMKSTGGLNRFHREFSKLLDFFCALFMESERKSHKILEMTSKNYPQKEKLEDCKEGNDVASLKKQLKKVQIDLDTSNELKRDLFDEIEDLKEYIKRLQDEMEEKEAKKRDIHEVVDAQLQTSEELLDRVSVLVPDHKALWRSSSAPAKEDTSDVELEEVTHKYRRKIKTLTTNLKIVTTDLQVYRKKENTMKREIQERDSLIKEYSKQLSDKEINIEKMEREKASIKEQRERITESLKSQIDTKEKENEEILKDLWSIRDDRDRLLKEMEGKNKIIKDLMSKLNELEVDNSSLAKRAELFEQHLAKGQTHMEMDKQEIKKLRSKVVRLAAKVTERDLEVLSVEEQAKKAETIPRHEKIVEYFKAQMLMKDRRIQTVRKELEETIQQMHVVKKEFRAKAKENTALATEILQLKKTLKERNNDLNLLKVKLKSEAESVVQLKQELKSRIVKLQVALEQRNKFQTSYNHMHLISNQQQAENSILNKRQEYLVRILKEKNIEIEKLVRWRRY